MNVIIPLSNENYYRLELDNLKISSDLIVQTHKIIKSENNDKKIIKKVVDLIKKTNNIGVFDVLINLLDYTIWIGLFKQCFVLKYYWDDELLKRIEDINKFKIHSYILNYAENQHITQNTIRNQNIIKLSNSYDSKFNYISKILIKRICKFKKILEEIFEPEHLDHFLENSIGCEYVVYSLGCNELFLVNDNLFIQDFLSIELILTFFPIKKTTFKIKPDVIFYSLCDFYCYKLNNLIIRIWKKSFDTHNVFSVSNAYIELNASTENEINSEINASGYQKFNFDFYQIIKMQSNEYYKFNNILNNTSSIKSGNKCYLKINLDIQIDKIIKKEFFKCYECKKIWNGYSLPDYKLHCIECGIKNYNWVQQKADLTGLTFFITGIRVKIGLATTLRLLRAGAKVIGTTRYPNFALYNYSKEPDYEKWKNNLSIIQADFLVLDSVYKLLEIIEKYTINGFINMAFRTIRPSEYYVKSVEELETQIEQQIYIENNTNTNVNITDILISNKKSQYYLELKEINTSRLICWKPEIMLNKFGDVQEIPHDNSWNQTIDQVDPKEIVECMALNQLVPTLLINKLKSKLIEPKFIINVGSFEGQFDTPKTDKHIHTNMCKSALNMLIRSLEEDPDQNLHTYTINPGYITGMKINNSEHDFPLKPIDGASRITWPIFQFANGIKLDKSWTKIGNYEKAKW